MRKQQPQNRSGEEGWTKSLNSLTNVFWTKFLKCLYFIKYVIYMELNDDTRVLLLFINNVIYIFVTLLWINIYRLFGWIWKYMYEFWCGVILCDVRSAILTAHHNEYIYFHIRPITFLLYTRHFHKQT